MHLAKMTGKLANDKFHCGICHDTAITAEELGVLNVEFCAQPIEFRDRSFEPRFQSRSKVSNGSIVSMRIDTLLSSLVSPLYREDIAVVWDPEAHQNGNSVTNNWGKITTSNFLVQFCLESDSSPSLPPLSWRRRAPPWVESNGRTGR